MLISEIIELAKKADTLSDIKSLNILQAILPELKSSSKPGYANLASKIEKNLSNNEHYQTYLSSQTQVKKEEKIKEERKEHYERYEMKSNQQAANNKVQEDKKKAAEAERIKSEDLAYYKRINDQVAYNNRINQIFLSLN